MKLNTYVQVSNKPDSLVKDVEKRVKDDLKVNGITQTKVEELNVYIKPVEEEVFYTVKDKDGEVKTFKLI